MPELTDTFYGNPLQTWLIAVAVTTGTLIALRLVEQVLIVRVEKLAQRTNTSIDDAVIGALRKTKLLYLLIVSVFMGSVWLSLPEDVRSELIDALFGPTHRRFHTALRQVLPNLSAGEVEERFRFAIAIMLHVASGQIDIYPSDARSLPHRANEGRL